MVPDPDRRWICDEMLGRLARYVRFLGYDVLYAQGVKDAEILQQAKDQDRWVLTRDKVMAERSRRVLLLHSVEVEEQLREVRELYPALHTQVSFVRCSLCNGPLAEVDRSSPNPPRGVPEAPWSSGTPIYVCGSCGQHYWEGSHTDEIRRSISRALSRPVRESR